MRAYLVVVDQPFVSPIANLRKSLERLNVEKLVTNARIERFDPSVLSGLAGVDEMQQHVMIDRPLQHDAGDIFWAVVDSKSRWISADGGDVVERSNDAAAGERKVWIKREPFAAKPVLDRKQPDFSS